MQSYSKNKPNDLARIKRIAPFLFHVPATLFLIPAAALAQGGGPGAPGGPGFVQMVGSGSVDRASPEASAPGNAVRIALMDIPTCELPTLWSNTDLGVPESGNVDAVSYPWWFPGGNQFPLVGPALGGTLHEDQIVQAVYTVDRTSVGPPSTVVNDQFFGNGAASDTFRVSPYAGAPVGVINTATQETDGSPCLTVKGIGLTETDLDAITGRKSAPGLYPVFYSVDSTTVMSLPLGPGGPLTPVSPADILVAVAPGIAAIAFSAAAIGLGPGDDVDALCVDRGLGHFVYSLTVSSPSAQLTYPVIGQLGGAGLYVFPGAPVTPWATPSQMGLRAPIGVFGTLTFVPGDELNGVIIGDPIAVPDHGVTLIADGPFEIGAPVELTLCAPDAPDQFYLIAASFGTTGFPLQGFHIPLDPDFLFSLSLSPNPYMHGFVGVVESSGLAFAEMELPIDHTLAGMQFFLAGMTLTVNPAPNLTGVSPPLTALIELPLSFPVLNLLAPGQTVEFVYSPDRVPGEILPLDLNGDSVIDRMEIPFSTRQALAINLDVDLIDIELALIDPLWPVMDGQVLEVDFDNDGDIDVLLAKSAIELLAHLMANYF